MSRLAAIAIVAALTASCAAAVVPAAIGVIEATEPVGNSELTAAKASFAVQVSEVFDQLRADSPDVPGAVQRLEQPLVAILRNVDDATRRIVAVEFADALPGKVSPQYVTPKLRISTDESGVSYDPNERQVIFGTDVLAANLLASVETVLGNADVRKQNGAAFTTPGASHAQEFEAITEFLGTVSRMPSLADYLAASETSSERYRRIADSLAVSTAVADGYYGSLAFVIGHELGHAALGHEFTNDCERQRADEGAADRFSALVLSDAFMLQSVQTLGVQTSSLGDKAFDSFRPRLELPDQIPIITRMVFINDEQLEYLNGFVTFLEKAYAIGPFAKDRGCYPSAEDRLRSVRSMQKLAIDRRGIRVLEQWVDRARRRALWSNLAAALLGG